MFIVFFYSADLFKGPFVNILVSNGFQYKSSISPIEAKVIINPESMYITVISDNFPGYVV